MEEYKTYKLEDITKGKGCYGIAASAVPFSPSLFTYLRITDINDDGTLNKTGLMSVDDANASNYLLEPNDIVFARTGNSTGRTYFYDGSEGKLVYAGFLIKFSLDDKKVNPRILKYYTHSKPYYDWVHSFDTGGTRGNINAKTFGNLPIVLPSRKAQDRIVDIMKSFDDKIECNRRLNDNFTLSFLLLTCFVLWLLKLRNDNLEQQAQALFKSWFVDFEPFKDGEFVESEIGMIPKGWRVGTLGELCTFKRGKNLLTKDSILGEVPVVAGGLEPSCYHNVANTKSPVITVSGSGANAGFMRMYYQEVWASDCSFIDSTCENLFFVYCFLTINRRLLRHAQTGAVQPHVKPADIHNFELVIPPKEIINQFQRIVSDTFTLRGSIEKESRRLAQLRDALLPRLMSGDLKVNEVDCLS